MPERIDMGVDYADNSADPGSRVVVCEPAIGVSGADERSAGRTAYGEVVLIP